MGIDLQTARFLTAAGREGAIGGEFLMLGRQTVICSGSDILKTAWGRVPTAQGSVSELLKTNDYAESFFRWLGASKVESVDISAYEGATLLADLNNPAPLEWHRRFASVFDGGTTEHIFDVAQAVRNIRTLLKPGGWVLSVVPGNNFMGHAFYQFSPEFLFRAYGREAGFGRVAIFAAELTEKGDGSFFRVVDPAVSGERGVFRNALPLLLYCIAQRADDSEKKNVPMQSDYVSAWSSEEIAKGNWRSLQTNKTRDALRKITTKFGGLWLKSILPMRWNPKHFRRLDSLEAEIRRFISGG
jgi:hypothetical protein